MYKGEFEKELVEYLDWWCKKQEDQFNRWSWELKGNGCIYVYHYNSSNDIKANNVNTFYKNEELKTFVENHKEYVNSNIEFEEKMKKELADDGMFI